jgi:hypothetical protein
MTGLQILNKTQRWTRVPNGEFWRECIARRADGELRIVLVRDDVLARAA